MKQPISVTITCWVIIALGIEAIVGSLSGVAEATLREMLSSTGASMSLSSVVIWVVAYCSITIVLAAFMLAGENWARITYLTLSTLMLLFQFAPQPLQIAAITISSLKLFIFGFLLLRPAANEYFSQSPPTAAQQGAPADRPRPAGSDGG